MASSVVLALALVQLLILCGETDSTTPIDCSVTQLTVNGCRVFVHDVTGAKDFVVEPLMCVTQNISNANLQYNPLIKKIFLSVAVQLRDEGMRSEIQNQLNYLSPKSLKFANVADISVSMDASSAFPKTLWFQWSPDEPVGYLRLGCNNNSQICYDYIAKVKTFNFDALNSITATAKVKLGSRNPELKYKLMVKNQKFLDHEFYASKLDCMSDCDKLQFLQSVIHGNCTARVHQNENGRFYIEPLLCHNIPSLINTLIIYDFSRDMHYLELDIVLQDDVILNAVKSKLANPSKARVSFMQLRQVKIVVPSFLSSRFEIAPLMLSGDWRSGQLRVYCKKEDDCKFFRYEMIVNPWSFWGNVKFELTSEIPSQCIVQSEVFFYNVKLTGASSIGLIDGVDTWSRYMLVKKFGLKSRMKAVDGRNYVIIQQRMTDSMSFARLWNEYESGFGNAVDFWIGLSKIHSLSTNGATLRVEMKLMNGTEQHQEYAGFKVGDASTNYTMTCGGVVLSRSSNIHNTMATQNGMQFSTMDRDNDEHDTIACSADTTSGGNGGWWFNKCGHSNPNNVYGSRRMWFLGRTGWQSLSEIRLMLQI